MKTVIYTAVVLFMNFNFYSQQQDLFDTKWYATEIFIDGNIIPIPVLSVNSPQGCYIGIRVYSYNNGEGAVDISICWPCQAHIEQITNTSFISNGFACLTCDFCAPCHPNKPESICEEFDNGISEIQHTINDFFGDYQVEIIYAITPLPEDHFQLKTEKLNGDYILFGTESTLSIQENETLTFSIVPNPASNTLVLTGLKSDVGSVVIYTLNGNEIYLASETDTYDISHLATGLYFITVTTVDGQKAVKKFIKN